MSEAKFKKLICDAAKIQAHVTNIETSTMNGVFDTHMCSNGVDIWVEFKVAVQSKVLLRKEQNAWGRRRANQRGRAFVVALMNERIMVWCFPNVNTEMWGEYLMIVNEPLISQPIDNVDRIINFLFTFTTT